MYRKSQEQEKILQGIGDIWDSGKIHSSDSVNIPYEGKELVSNKRFYWAIQLWGNQGNFKDVNEVSYFDTGLSREDWTAKWIWRPGTIVKNDFVQFRKAFSLENPVRLDKIYISAHNYFRFFVNGEIV